MKTILTINNIKIKKFIPLLTIWLNYIVKHDKHKRQEY